MNNITKIDGQRFAQNIELPEETLGLCATPKCTKYTYLGDGYCLKCWDKGHGFDAQFPSKSASSQPHYNRKNTTIDKQQAIRRNTW